MAKLVGVVFAGGNGTRLWPLSTADNPKQYALNIGGRSPFQNVLQALVASGCDEIVACISCRHLDLAMEQVRETRKPEWPRVRIVAENFSVGTAMVYASIVDLYPPETHMVFLPADAWFLHPDRFSAHIQQLTKQLNHGALMLGAPPWFMSHQLGYVVGQEVADGGDWCRPTKFVQYPNAEQLHELARIHHEKKDHVLWNTAITIATAGFWQDLMATDRAWCFKPFNNPIIRGWDSAADVILSDTSGMQEKFAAKPSVDAAFIEPNLARFMVVPHHSGWCDLGTYQSLAKICPEKQQSICTDTVVGITNGNNWLIAASSEGTIVAPRENYAMGAVDQLRDLLRQHTAQPEDTFEARKWGYFRILDQGEYHRVKELVIFPGCSTSMQRHRERSEFWLVKEGCAQVAKPMHPYGPEGELSILPLSEGHSRSIPAGEWHQISNQENCLLRILEVWHGPHMSEDDIERQSAPGE